MIKKICQQCKKTFLIIPSISKRRKFCSLDCKKKGMKGRIFGHKFQKGILVWNKGKHWSKEHRKKLSEIHKRNPNRFWLGKKGNQVGEKHWNWQGGKSYEKYPQDWTITLRRSIRERDNYTCQKCKKQQGDIAFIVHHKDYDKKNCNPENLITLCRSCHLLVHNGAKLYA